MSAIFDIFIIIFIIILFQPVVRQKMLEAARMRLLKSIETKRGTRVIAMIHREETLALLGFPLARYIDIHDSEEVLRAIKLTDPNMPIDLILHTPGGLVLATELIAMALCRHPGKVTVFVPHYAMSGGTLLALAADEIVMDENGVLGPVDPQLGQWPANSILKAVEQKQANEVDDETLIMADVARKAVGQIRSLIINILSHGQMPQEKAEALADMLSSGIWTHDYPINVGDAKEMGLSVNTDVPQEVYQLMNLFPQAGRGRPSVLYIPMQYPTRSGERGQNPAGGKGEIKID
jgi:ClpP class serine protease